MRRSGKTTRMIDAAIQELFTTGQVYIPSGARLKVLLDKHGERGYEAEEYNRMIRYNDMDGFDSSKIQDYFCKRFKDRLFFEHGSSKFEVKGFNFKVIG